MCAFVRACRRALASMCACVHVRVRVCVRVCVLPRPRACVRECACACVRPCASLCCEGIPIFLNILFFFNADTYHFGIYADCGKNVPFASASASAASAKSAAACGSGGGGGGSCC